MRRREQSTAQGKQQAQGRQAVKISKCCKDCRFLDTGHGPRRDGTCRCLWKNKWVRPQAPACWKFSYR